MQIVLPGALPDAAAAKALADHLPRTAPTLVRWLEQARPEIRPVNPRLAGCTPYEQWQLDNASFVADDKQNLGAGLGPLRCQQPADPGTAVWLAELVHLAASQEGAILLPAHQIAIEQSQSLALFDSTQQLFPESGFQLLPDSTNQWRVVPPTDFALPSVSPQLVSSSTVNQWWPQDKASREWRRLFNELQMLWYSHPVNIERQAHGKPAINGLWLYGGARPEQLHPAAPLEQQIYDDLDVPARHRDWASWLTALDRLEKTVFAPAASASPPRLVLLGTSRLITTRPTGFFHWLRWPGQRRSWRYWWSHQN